ncbi:MAG: DUF1289 domain-containing protein [Porticoccaceae bacterium]|jgi:predicted Fe-S protein YdhL (DUF1289 family)
MTSTTNPVASPCVAVCVLDDRDTCTGCLRTRDEITRWRAMDDGERRAVLREVAARRGPAGSG